MEGNKKGKKEVGGKVQEWGKGGTLEKLMEEGRKNGK